MKKIAKEYIKAEEYFRSFYRKIVFSTFFVMAKETTGITEVRNCDWAGILGI